jgi:hypothetical protein
MAAFHSLAAWLFGMMFSASPPMVLAEPLASTARVTVADGAEKATGVGKEDPDTANSDSNRHERPLARTWWPYYLGAAAAAAAVGGYGFYLAITERHSEAPKIGGAYVADVGLGLGIAGVCASGSLMIIGLVLHLTWEPEGAPGESLSQALLTPVVLPEGGVAMSLGWTF